jgi:hypothetical protein
MARTLPQRYRGGKDHIVGMASVCTARRQQFTEMT